MIQTYKSQNSASNQYKSVSRIKGFKSTLIALFSVTAVIAGILSSFIGSGAIGAFATNSSNDVQSMEKYCWDTNENKWKTGNSPSSACSGYDVGERAKFKLVLTSKVHGENKFRIVETPDANLDHSSMIIEQGDFGPWLLNKGESRTAIVSFLVREQQTNDFPRNWAQAQIKANGNWRREDDGYAKFKINEKVVAEDAICTSFTIDTNKVIKGGEVYLSWSTTNTVTIENNFNAPAHKVNSDGGYRITNINQDTTFTITPVNADGVKGAPCTVTVTVEEPVVEVPKAECTTFVSDVYTVYKGGEVYLSWNTYNATSIETNFNAESTLVNANAYKISNINDAKAYSITAINADGVKAEPCTVTIKTKEVVIPTPKAECTNLVSDVYSVYRGGEAYLSWDTYNATSIITNFGADSTLVDAVAYKISNINDAKTYSITPVNADGVEGVPCTIEITIKEKTNITVDKKDKGNNTDVILVDGKATFSFDIVVSNTSNVDAENVIVVDSLPEGTTYKTSSDNGSYTDTNNTVTWTIGTLKANESKTVIITIETNASGEYYNYVSVTTTTPEVSTNDNSDTEDANAIKPVAISVCDTITSDVTSVYNGGEAYLSWLVTGEDGTTIKTNIPGVGNTELEVNGYRVVVDQVTSYSITPVNADGVEGVPCTIEITIKEKTNITVDKKDKGNNTDVILVDGKATFSFDIVVSNTSNVDAENVIVVDSLPIDTKYLSSTDNGAFVDGDIDTVTWTIGTLKANESKTVSIVVEADKADFYANRVDVTTTTPETNTNDNSDTEDANSVVPAPKPANLEIEKYCSVDGFNYIKADEDDNMICKYNVGDTIYFAVDVENTGETTANGVTIDVDDTCADFAPVTEVRNIAPGEIAGWTYSCTAEEEDMGGVQTSMAMEMFSRKTDPVSIEIVEERELKVDLEKTCIANCEQTIANGEWLGGKKDVEFTMTITNVGERPIHTYDLSDTIPACFEYVSSTPEYTSISEEGIYVWWLMTHLEKGDSTDIKLTLSWICDEEVVETNCANAWVTDGDDNTEKTDCADAKIIEKNTVLNIEKYCSVDGINYIKADEDDNLVCTYEVGDTIYMSVDVTNTGDYGIEGVSIVVDDTCSNNSPEATDTRTIAPGELVGWTYNCTADVDDVGTETSNATESFSSKTDPVTIVVNEVRLPQLELDKSCVVVATTGSNTDCDVVESGDVLRYTITVKNSGENNSGLYTVYDDFPEEALTKHNVNNANVTNTNGDILFNWSFDNIEAGKNLVITYEATVKTDGVANGQTFANFARVDHNTCKDEAGTIIDKCSDKVTSTIKIEKKSILVDKECVKKDTETACADAKLAPGARVIYTITVTNNGEEAVEVNELVDTYNKAELDVDESTISIIPDIFVDGKITWKDIGQLESGKSIEVTYEANVPTDVKDGTEVDNYVVVTADQNDQNLKDNDEYKFVVNNDIVVKPFVSTGAEENNSGKFVTPFVASAGLLALGYFVIKRRNRFGGSRFNQVQ